MVSINSLAFDKLSVYVETQCHKIASFWAQFRYMGSDRINNLSDPNLCLFRVKNVSSLVSDIALGIGFIIGIINFTDCDVITDTPKPEVYQTKISEEYPRNSPKIPEVYQRDSPKIPEVYQRESLPVLLGNDSRCRISEYQCSNKKCVPVNRFCDGTNDCGDSSDEPRHCTREFSRPIVS